MTLQDALEYGRNIMSTPRPAWLDANTSIKDLSRDKITQLFIRSDYNGELPDLSLFPNLISFKSYG